MKNKFLLGLFVGALVTALGISGGYLVYRSSRANSELFKNAIAAETGIAGASSEKGGSAGNSGTAGNSGANVSSEKDVQVSPDSLIGKAKDKVSVLETMIDYYYYEDVDDETLVNGMYYGLVDSLGDVYSTYYNEEEFDALMESSSGVYCGIGATVSQNSGSKILTIVKPFANCPAYNAGMLPGDIIVKVDGTDVVGMDINLVVGMMKGEEGTKVTVTVAREGEDDYIDLVITRARIEIPTIEYEMLPDKIGYISISEFDEITVPQYLSAIDDLEKQGMKGLIVDLRDNPGGLLDSVCKMLDRMLPEGTIVYTIDKYGNREDELSTADEEFNLPLAVLVNGNSASASEIYASAIQDYKKGTIMGTQSFGKGIVQSVIPLGDGTAVKLTNYFYYTPLGRKIHGEGVTPDILVELDEELRRQVVISHDEDNQLQAAIKEIKRQMK